MLNLPMENAGPRLSTRNLLASEETKEEQKGREATFTETSSTARQHIRDSDASRDRHLRPRDGDTETEMPDFPRPHWWSQDLNPSSLVPSLCS